MEFPNRTEAIYRTMHNARIGYSHMNQGIRRLPQWAHILGDEPYDMKILEIGCGNGHLCAMLSSLSMGFDVTGLDIVPGSYDREGYKFVKHDINLGRLPFEDNKFDLCLSFDVIEHLPPKWVEEHVWDMFRVCGKVAGTVACFPNNILHLTVKEPAFWKKLISKHSKKEMEYRVFEANAGKTVLFFTKEEVKK